MFSLIAVYRRNLILLLECAVQYAWAIMFLLHCLTRTCSRCHPWYHKKLSYHLETGREQCISW